MGYWNPMEPLTFPDRKKPKAKYSFRRVGPWVAMSALPMMMLMAIAWPLNPQPTDPAIESAWRAAREKTCRTQAYRLANRVDGRTFSPDPVERVYETCLEGH